MSILTRIRAGTRPRADRATGGETAVATPEREEDDARLTIWPLVVLVAGALLSGFWVLGLLWAAYLGLLWLLGTG